MSHLRDKILKIGEKLVDCKLCTSEDGIENSEFIPPRCLYLDPIDAESISCIVVGINPGRIKKGDKEYKKYQRKKNAPKYQIQIEYFKENKGAIPYSKRIENLLNSIGLKQMGKGILWTELCKCQNHDPKEPLPLQTIRKCAKIYLSEELKVAKEAPIVAFGSQPYNMLSFLYPERAVIGFLHPSGAHINYDVYTKYCAKQNKIIFGTIDRKECRWMAYPKNG